MSQRHFGGKTWLPSKFSDTGFSENVVVAETGYQRLDQAQVVQTLDNAIHRINHYPVDKYYENQLYYPLDRLLSDG